MDSTTPYDDFTDGLILISVVADLETYGDASVTFKLTRTGEHVVIFFFGNKSPGDQDIKYFQIKILAESVTPDDNEQAL